LLDLGTNAPAPAHPESRPAFKPAMGTGWKRDAAKAGLDDSVTLAQLDSEMAEQSANQGMKATYRQYLLPDARLHRAGVMPLADPSSILAFLDEQEWTSVSYEPIATGLSQSADLGYSYGKYSLLRKGVPEKGYYTRVWKRDNKGYWKIAMDVANALPPEPSKP